MFDQIFKHFDILHVNMYTTKHEEHYVTKCNEGSNY